ncbi:MAG TPA: hypothetical protein VKY32_06010 [Flavobacterium sp.]|nr:hypothetical protein [Flavobacterium sp.]
MPLKNTIVIVTHNMQQAIRTADYTGFMYLGDLIEFGKTNQVFEKTKRRIDQTLCRRKFWIKISCY